MTCDELADGLTDFLEGELSEAETDAALAHLASCSRCEVVLADTRAVIEAGRSHGRVTLTDDHRSDLLASVLDNRTG